MKKKLLLIFFLIVGCAQKTDLGGLTKKVQSSSVAANTKLVPITSEKKCIAQGGDWYWDQHKKECLQIYSITTNEIGCSGRGKGWIWDERLKKCVESYVVITDELGCAARGDSWTWSVEKKSCSQHFTQVTDEMSCQNLGANWVWNKNTSLCIQNFIQVSDKESCEKLGSEWSWDNDIRKCLQKFTKIEDETSCLNLGDAWVWNKDTKKCLQKFSKIENAIGCKELGDDWEWIAESQVEGQIIPAYCKQNFNTSEGKDACLGKPGGDDRWKWTDGFNGAKGVCEEIVAISSLQKQCETQGNYWFANTCKKITELNISECRIVYPVTPEKPDDHWSILNNPNRCFASMPEKQCVEQGTNYSWSSWNGIPTCFYGYCPKDYAHAGWEGDSPICKDRSKSFIGPIALGDRHGCASFSGVLKCWGYNDYGAAYGAASNNTSPVTNISSSISFPASQDPSMPASITSVAAGRFHACAVRNNKLYCWGPNNRLGIGIDNGTLASPTEVVFSGITPEYVRKVAINYFGYDGNNNASRSTSCAIVKDKETKKGKIYCWGYGNFGIMTGSGYNVPWKSIPEMVVNLPVNGDAMDISVGGSHACAVIREPTNANSSTSSLWCWGREDLNQSYNRKTGTIDYLPAQKIVGTDGASKVACGERHTCAVINGAVKCSGENNYKVLGPASTSLNYVAGSSLGLLESEVTNIASGTFHNCVLKTGKAYCWGYNSDNQLGKNTPSTSDTPLEVSLVSQTITKIVAGDYNACAVATSSDNIDNLYCWGDGGYSSLPGDKTYATPTKMYTWP